MPLVVLSLGPFTGITSSPVAHYDCLHAGSNPDQGAFIAAPACFRSKTSLADDGVPLQKHLAGWRPITCLSPRTVISANSVGYVRRGLEGKNGKLTNRCIFLGNGLVASNKLSIDL